MKNLFNYLIMLMVVALSAVTTISCGGGDDPTPTPTPTPQPEKKLTGTWTYNFSSGYCEMTFNADGTGSYFEFDHGKIESSHKFTYTFTNNIVTIYYDNGKKEESAITWLNDNSFTSHFDEDETWVKKGSSTVTDNSIVGTWRYTFSSGYGEMTFNADGTGSYFEFDHGKIESSHKFTYTYSNNTVTISYDNEKTESSTITWVTKDKITAHFDEDETWVRQ